MMTELFYLALVFISGMALGIFFFGGLWFTVKKITASSNPALWVLGSSVLRLGITLAGFYYLSQGIWSRLIICVIGFIAARFIVIRITGNIDKNQAALNKEIKNEA